MNAKQLINKLNNPDREYSAIPFWFLNDELVEEKLREQIEDFKSKGIDAIIPHPRIGLSDSIEYLSDSFFEKIEYIVKTCKENDVKVILYDEGMYPSGAAGGIIARVRPDLKAKGLFLSSEKEGKVISQTDKGRLVYTFSNGRIRGLHYGEDDGEENQPYAADILDPEAVDLFIKYTHEQYYERLKEYFGTTIIGFFTDEPNPAGRCREKCFAWYKGLEKDVAKNGGNVDELFALFENEQNCSTKIYTRLVRERETVVFYGKLKKWCNEHGIFLCGHSEKSDDVTQLLSFDIPGQDLVFRFVAPDTGDLVGNNSVLGKVPADIAEYTGAERNMCEVLGVCGKSDNAWDLPPSEIKWFLDYLAVRGTSAFVLHAFYYSLRGKRKDERPPDVGPNTEWWEDYAYFSNFIKRVSYLNSGIKSTAKLGVVCDDGRVPFEEVEDFYKNQIEFRYLPQFVLNKYKNKGEKLPFEKVLSFGDDFSVKQFIGNKKVAFENYQPNVRINRFDKDGVLTTILANCGKTDVIDNLVIKTDCNLIVYDLWSGEYYTPKTENDKDGKKISIKLKFRDCVAIIEDKENSVICDNREEEKEIRVEFNLDNESTNCKRYKAEINADGFNGNEIVKIKAEETVRWYINDQKVYATFWNEHVFPIGKFIKSGNCIMKIEVCGSASNIYGNKKVPFGLF